MRMRCDPPTYIRRSSDEARVRPRSTMASNERTFAMRIGLLPLLACICLLAVSPAFAKRDKIECSKVSLTKLEPGWGKLPPVLQKLPPGATLCGAAGETAFIASELDAQALEKFYAPLFAAVGCKLTCTKKEFRGDVC